MVDGRMDIKKAKNNVANIENDIANIEMAHYIMLSLYREYSVLMMKNSSGKEEYITKMRQIKNDIKYLNKVELVEKANKFYKKILQNMKNK